MANLTAKELDLLDRQLNHESLLVKKYKTLAGHAQDTKIRTKFEQMAARHENHFEKLLKFLK